MKTNLSNVPWSCRATRLKVQIILSSFSPWLLFASVIIFSSSFISLCWFVFNCTYSHFYLYCLSFLLFIFKVSSTTLVSDLQIPSLKSFCRCLLQFCVISCLLWVLLMYLCGSLKELKTSVGFLCDFQSYLEWEPKIFVVLWIVCFPLPSRLFAVWLMTNTRS